jgi:hypothetical protein
MLRHNITYSTLPVGALFACVASLSAVTAQADNTFSDFFEQGKLIVDARYRFEHVDQEGIANEANAHTLRARLGFQTGKVWDLQFLLEGEGVFHLSDEFNDTVPNNPAFPIVADPEDIQINRLQVEWSGLPQTAVTIGRQRMNLDNQRFIGGVAFRQNEQTFDALRITNTSIDSLTLTYAYISQINRVFGEESIQGAYEGDSHIVNAGYAIANWGTLTGYAYLLDLEDFATQSTATYGARFAGKHALSKDFNAVYAFEYASQSDYATNPGEYELDYWMVEAGIAAHGFTLLGGMETLEGDGTRGFSTPLATLHKFQGHADVFLTTPANGIFDRYATLSYDTKLEDAGPVTGLTAAVTYHDFEAERTSASFGSETDVELVARMGDHWSTGIKYATYDGEGAFPDRDKLWLTVEFKY